jgi:uncharacterized membrane protein YgdD (TMEM256/DUF423 family)
MLAIWQTAVLYQLVHGLGLLALALMRERGESQCLRVAGTIMLAGILVFSGSLYALVLTGHKWLGAITPIGGAAFLIAWGLAGLSAYRRAR